MHGYSRSYMFLIVSHVICASACWEYAFECFLFTYLFIFSLFTVVANVLKCFFIWRFTFWPNMHDVYNMCMAYECYRIVYFRCPELHTPLLQKLGIESRGRIWYCRDWYRGNPFPEHGRFRTCPWRPAWSGAPRSLAQGHRRHRRRHGRGQTSHRTGVRPSRVKSMTRGFVTEAHSLRVDLIETLFLETYLAGR